MTDEDVAIEALRTWKRDPVRMARDLFDFTPDRWQAEALRAFADPDPTKQRIALQACAGPGKSVVLAICGWNFLLCYSDGEHHPNGYAVSITGENLRDNLWKELAILRGRSPLLMRLFEQTAEKIFAKCAPLTWWIMARSFAKSADQEAQGRTLSGLHARSILYLPDEAGDMPPAVLRAAEQGLSNCEFGKIVMAGNPTSHQGALYHCVTEQAHLWHVVRITGDPDDVNRSPRVGLEWAKQQIAQYGRENPWVMAYILGLFPPTSLNALLGPDEMRAAMDRHLTEDQYIGSQKRLGIDVARFGDDATVIFPRQGIAAFNPVEMRNARTNEIAARISLAKSRWSSELELIDSTGGWAAGVVDSCLLAGIPVLEVNFSGKADDSRYFNKRSEINFRAAEWVKNGGALPNHPRILREACAVTYYFDNGKLRVVEKDQIKASLNGQSPDFWDAFCVTFAIVELPTMLGEMGVLNALAGAGAMKSEWDPYREDAA